ncbi:MAG: secondary thiamine-phosphate synthase enzyme YjbQ [Myxococcales bacterium]|nr:secondary thiamine-phosphate synthase enzyme YjbQ [Myxococcales bacterium]MCB9576133.1 YjbQ family protein [Polyangiaceae bacterium]
MRVHSAEIELTTRGDADIVDITDRVRAAVAKSGIGDGIGCVFVPGATAGITTIEYEPGCIEDLRRLLDQLAPPGRDYAHERAWHDGNGHSHLRAALIGPSLSFPISEGQPTLGTWQHIVLCDFDNRPRSRRVTVKLVG